MRKSIGKLRGKTRKYQPAIMAAGAVVGLGATIFFVARGQMKADDILAEAKRVYDSDRDTDVEVILGKRELFDLTWTCYIPAAISASATLFFIIGGSYISMKQIATLTSSLAFMSASRGKLEEAIKEKYGEDALKELKEKMHIGRPEKQVVVVKTVAEETGMGDLLCFEGYSGRWFRSSEEAVKEAIRWLQEKVVRDECAAFNDFYDLLKIEQTHFGYEYGWINTAYDSNVEQDGDPIRMELCKVFVEEKGEEVLFIDIYTYPIESWYEY